MALSEAVSGGDRRKSLEALRDHVAAELDACDSSRDTAALSRTLMDVLKQLDELGAPADEAEGTVLDEFTKRLQGREKPSRKGLA